MEIATNKEDAERVKALHQWLVSQDIPRHQWGPLFGMALGQEIWKHSHSDPAKVLMGQMMATEFIVRYSIMDYLNA